MSEEFQSNIARIKERLDIVDLVREDGVVLKPSGVNAWSGLCPFHDDKNPSMTVSETFQNYKCFACGASGDIFSYMMERENLGFRDVLVVLAERAGVELDESSRDSEDFVNYAEIKKCLDVSHQVFRYSFAKADPSSAVKREVLKRNLSLTGIEYGFANEKRNSLYNFLKKQGFSDDVILASGMCKKGEYGVFDTWSGRLMFPIKDLRGEVVGFSGRKLYEDDQMSKYVNTASTPVFSKSKALFHVDVARKPAGESKTIYVAEGQFDVASLVEIGLRESVASSGTAFTSEQASICQRLVTQKGSIVFVFDGDEAGRNAAYNVFMSSPHIHSQSFVVALPEGKDPNDVFMEDGAEVLRNILLNQRVPLVDFVFDSIYQQHANQEGQVHQYFLEATKALAVIQDRSLYRRMVSRVAVNTFTEIPDVESKVKEAKKGSQSQFKRVKDEDRAEGATTAYSGVYGRSEGELTDRERFELFREVVNSDSYCQAYGRSVALVLMYPEKRKDFLRLTQDYTPSRMSHVYNDLLIVDKSNSDKIIFESLENGRDLAYLLSEEFFPYREQLTKDEVDEFYDYLMKVLSDEKKYRESRHKDWYVIKLLQDGEGTTGELEEALRSLEQHYGILE